MCKGREVITIFPDGSVESSLKLEDDKLVCKNTEECKMNITAENTEIGFSMQGEEIKVVSGSYNGKTVFELGE